MNDKMQHSHTQSHVHNDVLSMSGLVSTSVILSKKTSSQVPCAPFMRRRSKSTGSVALFHHVLAVGICGVFTSIMLIDFVLCNLMSLYACCTRACEHVLSVYKYPLYIVSE